MDRHIFCISLILRKEILSKQPASPTGTKNWYKRALRMRSTRDNYLYKRDGVFYFRQFVWVAGQYLEIKLSLRTTVYLEAKRRYSDLRAFIHMLDNHLMTTERSLTPEQIKNIVHRFFLESYGQVFAGVNFERLLAECGDGAVIEASCDVEHLKREKAEQITDGRYASYLKSRAGDCANETQAHVYELMYRSSLELSQMFLRRLTDGPAGLKIQDPYFCDLQEAIAGGTHSVAAHLAGAARVSAPSKSLEALISEYETLENGAMATSTQLNYGGSYKLLLQVLGSEKIIQDITKNDMFTVIDALRQRYIQKTGKGRSETISPATLNKHAGAYKGLFNWAFDRGYISINPMSEIKIPSKSAALDDRDPFTTEQIIKLFSSPLYTGFKNDSRRAQPGHQIMQDLDYWAPLISYYSGCRISEIASLRIEDIRTDYGVTYFDITVSLRSGKKVKTAAGKRQVPVHSQLIKMGLLDYIEKRKQAGWTEVFADAPTGKTTASRGSIYSKRFSNYLERIKVKTERTSFHSLRHTVSQAMNEAGIPDHHAGPVMGHKVKGMTYGVYGGKTSITRLKATLEAAQFPIDVPALIAERTAGKTLKDITRKL